MTAATVVQKGKGYPRNSLVLPGEDVSIPFGDADMLIVEYRPPVEETRAAMRASIERMRADKRRGDAVKFLRDFRSNPRG